MRFIILTVLSLAASSLSKPLDAQENGDVLAYYLEKLSEIHVIKKEPIKKKIFDLLQDQDSALVQHLAEICHSGDVNKLTHWSNDMKVRINKQTKHADLSKQLKIIAKTLKNKVNKCTRQYTADNGGDTKPGMPFYKVLEELFGSILKKNIDFSTKLDEIKQIVNLDSIIEQTQDLRTKFEDVVNNWVTDDLKKKAMSYINDYKNKGTEKVEKTKKSVTGKIDTFWGKVSSFFSFGDDKTEENPVVENQEIKPDVPEENNLQLVIYTPPEEEFVENLEDKIVEEEETSVIVDEKIDIPDETEIDNVKENHSALMNELVNTVDEVPAISDQEEVKENHSALMNELLNTVDKVPAEPDFVDEDSNEETPDETAIAEEDISDEESNSEENSDDEVENDDEDYSFETDNNVQEEEPEEDNIYEGMSDLFEESDDEEPEEENTDDEEDYEEPEEENTDDEEDYSFETDNDDQEKELAEDSTYDGFLASIDENDDDEEENIDDEKDYSFETDNDDQEEEPTESDEEPEEENFDDEVVDDDDEDYNEETNYEYDQEEPVEEDDYYQDDSQYYN